MAGSVDFAIAGGAPRSTFNRSHVVLKVADEGLDEVSSGQATLFAKISLAFLFLYCFGFRHSLFVFVSGELKREVGYKQELVNFVSDLSRKAIELEGVATVRAG